jgi:tetratricopeptide (TPR) repeat protein
MASLAHTQSAVLHLAADDRHAALEELNLAFSLGREQNLTGPKGQALAVVGCVYEHEGRHDKAVEAWDRARLLHERSAASADLGRTYNNVGVVHYTQGRFTSAIPFFERALEILSEADDVVTILAILNNNVRAYELHYLDRAAEFRTEMDQFAALLSDPELPRFDDLGAVFAFSARRVPGVDSYASNLVVADPAMVLPAYRLPPG